MNKVYKKVAEEISPLILVATLVLTSVLITFTANAETIMEVESVTIIGSKEDVKDLAGSGAVISNEDFQKTIKPEHKILKIKIINKFLFDRSFLFQLGSHWRELFKKNIIVIGLNPRIISNWIFLVLRRPLGLKTYVWGHAWPRKGPNSKTASIRHLMQRFASSTITYSEAQKKELKAK